MTVPHPHHLASEEIQGATKIQELFSKYAHHHVERKFTKGRGHEMQPLGPLSKVRNTILHFNQLRNPFPKDNFGNQSPANNKMKSIYLNFSSNEICST